MEQNFGFDSGTDDLRLDYSRINDGVLKVLLRLFTVYKLFRNPQNVRVSSVED